MRSDSSVVCWDFGSGNIHDVLFPFALLAIAVYVIGIAALIFYTLYAHRPGASGGKDVIGALHAARLAQAKEHSPANVKKIKAIAETPFRKRFGFLFLGLKTTWYHWEIINMGKKLLFALAFVIIEDPVDIALASIALIFLWCMAVYRFQPYETPLLNVFDRPEIVMVRSHMPGSEAKFICSRPSNTKCS